jgi:hypothetical protein
MAFEYVEGRSLRSWVERGPTKWPEVVSVALQVALALEEARRSGVIHRDIKPDNILECEPGRYKVADFGIAKWAGSSVQTQDGVILGTPAYISPVQVKGLAPAHQSDLYALGITMFELLTGRLPFYDENPALLLERHLTVPAPSVRTLVADIPPPLDRIVDRLLTKDREQRFHTAQELAVELGALVRPDPALPERPMPPSRPRSVERPRGAAPARARPDRSRVWFAASVVIGAIAMLALVPRAPGSRPSSSPASPASATPAASPAAEETELARVTRESQDLYKAAELLKEELPRASRSRLEPAELRRLAGMIEKNLDAYARLLKRAARCGGERADSLWILERTGTAVLDGLSQHLATVGLSALIGTQVEGQESLRKALGRVRAALREGAAEPHVQLAASTLADRAKELSGVTPLWTVNRTAEDARGAARQLLERLSQDRRPPTWHGWIAYVHLLDRAANAWVSLRRTRDQEWELPAKPSRVQERDVREELVAAVPEILRLEPAEELREDIQVVYVRLVRDGLLLIEDPLSQNRARATAAKNLSELLVRRALPCDQEWSRSSIRLQAIRRLVQAAGDHGNGIGGWREPVATTEATLRLVSAVMAAAQRIGATADWIEIERLLLDAVRPSVNAKQPCFGASGLAGALTDLQSAASPLARERDGPRQLVASTVASLANIARGPKSDLVVRVAAVFFSATESTLRLGAEAPPSVESTLSSLLMAQHAAQLVERAVKQALDFSARDEAGKLLLRAQSLHVSLTERARTALAALPASDRVRQKHLEWMLEAAIDLAANELASEPDIRTGLAALESLAELVDDESLDSPVRDHLARKAARLRHVAKRVGLDIERPIGKITPPRSDTANRPSHAPPPSAHRDTADTPSAADAPPRAGR